MQMRLNLSSNGTNHCLKSPLAQKYQVFLSFIAELAIFAVPGEKNQFPAIPRSPGNNFFRGIGNPKYE